MAWEANFDTTPLNNRRLVEHPVQTVAFYGVEEDTGGHLIRGNLNVIQPWLVAFQQFGIARVTIFSVDSLPIRNNHNLKSLGFMFRFLFRRRCHTTAVYY